MEAMLVISVLAHALEIVLLLYLLSPRRSTDAPHVYYYRDPCDYCEGGYVEDLTNGGQKPCPFCKHERY